MPINPEAVGTKGPKSPSEWSSKDSLLYALGVGAGTDPSGLCFVTENSIGVDQRCLPTQAVVLSNMGSVFAGIGTFNPAMLVHGSQSLTVHSELPVKGSAVTEAEITAIWDKGKGAVVEATARTTTIDGQPLFDVVMSAFIRGEGGWGGARGPAAPQVIPERAADATMTYSTRPDQALLYRLSGDRNPLHSDPQFAALAGFDRPILHGLCTYGFTGRALLAAVCEGDPARFGSMSARFSAPVFPGEDLTIEVWNTDAGAAFRTLGGDGRVVIDSGEFTLR